MIPQFAIIGHPNEGKSSVLSTLAEDDSVVISPIPGETRVCRTFPVVIDGEEMLEFIDTPGFQNPRRLFAGLRKIKASGLEAIRQLRQDEKDNPELADDCELLGPIIDGAAIIYVVDGSRPLRQVDRIEMEILRLSGQPRMAILNNKEKGADYIEEWKEEFRKNFNVFRLFNAHKATCAERISLLEALKAINQDLESVLNKVIDSFKTDWQRRNQQSMELICKLLQQCLQHQVEMPVSTAPDRKQVEEKLHIQYCRDINRMEKEIHRKIKALFKHNIFDFEFSKNRILHEDLFSEQTWQLLGLNRSQMMVVGGISGAGLGAAADLIAHGASLGLFMTVGGVLGSAGALFGGKKVSTSAKFMGLPLGGKIYRIGPNKNHNFPFIIMDRALLFYSYTINWAHGRRDYQRLKETGKNRQKQGITAAMSKKELKICNDFFKELRKNGVPPSGRKDDFTALLEKYMSNTSDD
ncbi:MAG: hypothetical protein CSB24_01840 [Deltaproteobacteria bacterium]|nr:MAG: hypothetical protein CSB24_01840 [Deltaproteobacteria bacterium]